MDTKLYILTGNIVSRKAGCVKDIRYLEFKKGFIKHLTKLLISLEASAPLAKSKIWTSRHLTYQQKQVFRLGHYMVMIA